MAIIAIPQPKDPFVRQVDFKMRMTTQERISIRTASQTDPIVFDFLDLLNSTNMVDTSAPQVIEGLNYLESQGLLVAGRVQEILA